ncbi:MAG TPA: HupE/UreJ family protein [Methyloceanibacter sp.]
MTRLAFILGCLLQAIVALPATAHELRPAYLDIRETATDEFAVVWKVPARGDLRLGLSVRMPDTCKPKSEPVGSIEDGAFFERWSMICAGGVKGHEIAIDGLRSTLTDALARIEYRDGSTQLARLTPEAPQFIASGVQTTFAVAQTYSVLGVEHILSGMDHLLFVLALILLIRYRWMLVKTITAFTVAHSITLAGAALGYISLPQPPVEATIALSIAFVARELARAQPGERRLSESYPWVIAFAFGLLHGFGFAGALKEIGLPQTDVPLALLTFNLGVEAGQLMFVAAVLLAYRGLKALYVPVVAGRVAAAYGIGSIATFWLVSRIASF